MTKKTIYISNVDNLWRAHTDTEFLGDLYILKSTALSVAINYVASRPEGECDYIRAQVKNGSYKIMWTYGKDMFPPGKIPLTKKNYSPSINT